jgi:drug/metabolite transporter (DMT)-like permease
MPAALQSAVVMTVLTAVALPIMFRDRIATRAPPSAWLLVAWLGVGDALNVALFFAAYQRTSVAVAVLTHYLTPLFVAVLAPLLLREPSRPRTYGAVAAAFVGLVLLLEPWRAGLSRADAVGALFGAASAVFYASNVLVNKRLVPWFSGSELMFFHGLVATPLLWLAVSSADVAAADTRALFVVVGGALGPGALAGLMFVWGLRRVAASHASVLTLLEPFVAVLLAGAFLGETLGPVPILGGLLILAGALAVVSGGRNDAAARAPGMD